VVVVVCLASCVYAKPWNSLPHHLKLLKRETRDDHVNFTPRELPCSYQVTYTEGSDSDHYYINNYHVKCDTVKDSELSETLIYDIENDKYILHAYDYEDKKCKCKDIEEESYLKMRKEACGFIENPTECEAVSNGDFKGKKCKVYSGCNNGDDELLFSLYADGDKGDNLIGIKTYLEGELVQTISVSVESGAPAKLFVMDSKVKGCDERAYVAPTKGICPGGNDDSVACSITVAKSVLVLIISLFILHSFF